MCGRLNVTDHPGIRKLMDDLGMPIYPQENLDLRPTQELLAIVDGDHLSARNMTWGIHPKWSSSLLINAKSETVSEKRTFAKAFKERRCLVPCTGWYEWKDEGCKTKQRYLFTHEGDQPFLMAGVWYPHEDLDQLVTLTTKPNKKCAEIHNRMPVVIEPNMIELWLAGSGEEVRPLMDAIGSDACRIEKVGNKGQGGETMSLF